MAHIVQYLRKGTIKMFYHIVAAVRTTCFVHQHNLRDLEVILKLCVNLDVMICVTDTVDNSFILKGPEFKLCDFVNIGYIM